MALIIGAILALLSIGIAAYPFLKARTRRPAVDTSAAMSQEVARLEAVFESIRTLDLDYQLGKVPEGLYRELLDGYRVQAALLLKEQAEKGNSGGALEPPESLLEQRVEGGHE